IVRTVSDVRVPYGRSVFINPISDLNIHMEEGDKCFVTALPDVLSQGPGFLTPERFPCDFGPADVKYSHLGARSPSEDHIRLQVRYDTATDTYVIPLRLTVEVLFIQRTVITKSLFLTVPELMGTTEPIDGEILAFTYDETNEQCQVATLPGTTGLPRYGHLLNDPSNGVMMSCTEFLSSGVRYKHTATTNSPNRDHIPMVVELLDSEGNVIKQEYFQVTVKIVEGLENTPPRLDFVSTSMMEVNQFVMTAFTNEMLRGSDVESNPKDLIFNITSPRRFQEGSIVSTEDRNQDITSFRQRDIDEYLIAYKPPNVDADLQRMFQIEMQIIDPDGGVSDPFDFIIVVNPMNTLAPVVTRNTGQLLYQGQSRELSSSQNLEISDEDNLQDVRLSVLRGTRHGSLSMGGGSYFTPADLDAGLVTYQHDGSNTYSDNIIFRMTDGTNEVEFLFPITIATLDNTPPTLEANTGITVNKGETVMVSQWVLNTADVDSDTSQTKFILEPPFSTEGEFILLLSDPPTNLEDWTLRSDNQWEKSVTEWTQQNITNMKLYYRHIGPHSTTIVMDTQYFRIQDSNDPPNQSDRLQFIAKVLPIDDIPPALHPSATLQMNVLEFELTPFKRRLLRYTDQDTNDKDLVYRITQQPVELSPITPLTDTGKIVLTEDPDTELVTFTQAQVNHHKVAYKPPDTELGIIARALQFQFQVSDDAGNVLPDQMFTIFLRPVDNKPPRIVNTGFSVKERGTTVITPDILDATDPDTDESVISFVMTSVPEHGALQYESSPLILGGAFTKTDISNFHIIYQHDGSESKSDQFSLEISDGMHNIPIVVKIEVEPVDDEQPLLAKRPGTVGFAIEVEERSFVTITTDVLSATDSDTNDLMLTYLVTEAAGKGAILVSGEPATSFTQENVRNGEVMYEHAGGEIGPLEDTDAFRLTLSDMSDEWNFGGNKVENVEVAVRILPVDSEAPIVHIGDDFIVDEGDKQMIEPIHLDATDVDTNDDDIICVITTQASEGFVENITPAPGSEKSRAGTPISSFTIGDIKAGNIYFVQSVHDGNEPTEDRFSFVCQDGAPNLSGSMFFNIAINPVNDETPRLYHTEFVVEEGGDLLIDLPRLRAEDDDVPEDQLIFTITLPPQNGKFMRTNVADEPVEISSFSLADVTSAADIIYQHDDTETTDDKVEITVSDGEHEVSKIIPILIIPVDDETPRMTINNGIDVELDATVVITNNVLKATDLDSEDSSLMYVITFPPQHGALNVTRDGEVTQLVAGSNFTQDDIDNDRISYTHTGHEGVRDLIKFDVTDGFNPLIDRYFYVNVAFMDMLFPDVINKGVTLKEGGRVTLTTDILSTADLNSADENLEFIIAQAPSRGHLESTDRPGVPITTFTQLDIAGNKIQYVHTEEDEVKMDSFEFQVTDGFNPVYRTFRVSIADVDNKKPVVTIKGLRVKEGATKLITPFELKVEDHDTVDGLLRIHITQAPVHGRIILGENTEVREFTMDDLNENRISYAHEGSETVADSFSFTVTDGTHDDFYVFPSTVESTDLPQRMDIEIVPVDNGVPQILVNRGAPTVRLLPNGDRGFRITKKSLSADDRDSDVSQLTYVITTPLEHGNIVNVLNDTGPIETFTQGDIDEMGIFYILNENTNATTDSFTFSIRDNGDNELTGQNFRFNWAFISLASSTYRISETKYWEVTLKRRGYLGETSFVGKLHFNAGKNILKFKHVLFCFLVFIMFMVPSCISTRDGTAKIGEDFRKTSASQVQFNPGQNTANWKMKILQDEKYEESEHFYIELSEPVMAILENPSNATVTITDAEDESTVFIPQAKYTVVEDIGELLVPLHRSGDATNEFMVICYTEPDTAAGTTPTKVQSYSDYISRPEDHNSLITFERGETEKFCRVVIIDDSLYEEDEAFKVKLVSPMGGRLGNFSTTEVVISADVNDVDADSARVTMTARRSRFPRGCSELSPISSTHSQCRPPSNRRQPSMTICVLILSTLMYPFRYFYAKISALPLFYFDSATYHVDESAGHVEVRVWRTGTDLSQTASITVQSKKSNPESARANEDYVGISKTLEFAPGITVQTVSVVILDDLGNPVLEGEETFDLVLRMPMGAILGDPKTAQVTINDTESDLPLMEFAQATYEVNEIDGEMSAIITRSGDLSRPAGVRCYTRQATAEVMMDYAERPNTDASVVHFEPGRICIFGHSSKGIIATIGFVIAHLFDHKQVLLQHYNIEFLLYLTRLRQRQDCSEAFNLHISVFTLTEPETEDNVTIVRIPVIRRGDKTKTSSVRFFTKDGNAKSGRDYNPVSRELLFEPGDSEHMVEVEVLYDDEKEIRESFTVRIEADVNMAAKLGACNPKHSNYKEVSSICESEGLDDSATKFRWLVAPPSAEDGVTQPLRDVAQTTFFTDVNRITLDSIYFKPGSRVACVARAVNMEGDVGLESVSQPVTVNSRSEVCPPRYPNSVGAEPFSAKIRYTGPSDPTHPNLIKLTVTIPHRDGLLPAISTRQLTNFEFTLSKDGLRVGNHRCSNIIHHNEVTTQYGFLSEATRNPNVIGETYPYQYNAALPPNYFAHTNSGTISLHRNLNLEACLWEFTSYYDMSELLSECGGQIGTDGQVRDYSGTYTIKLIPCTTTADQAYSQPIVCNPRDPLSFDMDIRFQQVSDPVAAEFSLNTDFFLLSKKSLYLSDGSMGFAEDSDVAFVEGSEIYGRVLVDPVQNLGNSFDAHIEKVFICSGRDGYVPKYNPANGEYGCLADAPNLRNRYKVLDKEQPDTQDMASNDVPFNAKLAIDDNEALQIVRQPGTDGFRMDSAPLFSVTVGREWYMHTIYTVKASNQRKRRSNLYTYHSLLHSSGGRHRRSAELADSIGEEQNRGTQMMHIRIDRTSPPIVRDSPNRSPSGVNTAGGDSGGGFPLLAVIIGAAVVLIVVIIVVAAVLYRRRAQSDPAPAAAAGARYTGGKHIVTKKKGAGAKTAV
uniref:Calx-beta domain-containing protein n=1 Tax=Ciona savignyi TaxID=51511 RepID=H2YPT4_CIOSA